MFQVQIQVSPTRNLNVLSSRHDKIAKGFSVFFRCERCALFFPKPRTRTFTPRRLQFPRRTALQHKHGHAKPEASDADDDCWAGDDAGAGSGLSRNETPVMLMMLALAAQQRKPVANADAALVHQKREAVMLMMLEPGLLCHQTKYQCC